MKLSEEQKGIIEYVKQGKTNIFIAKKMYLSKRSVERKLQKIYELFEVKNRISFIIEIMSMENAGLL